jgi:hypothetical protein
MMAAMPVNLKIFTHYCQQQVTFIKSCKLQAINLLIHYCHGAITEHFWIASQRDSQTTVIFRYPTTAKLVRHHENCLSY